MIDDLDLVEATLQHHLPMSVGEDKVLCACAEMFEGPVYQRRHVAWLIVEGRMCEDNCAHPSHRVT